MAEVNYEEILNEIDPDLSEIVQQMGEEHSNSDPTLSPSETIEIMDKFTQIYNRKHGITGSMFDKINIKDPSDTNDRMEQFYEYMKIHADLLKEDEQFTDVYEPDVPIKGYDNVRDIFALVEGKEAKIVYLSLSYISLITIGVRELKNTDWSIITLTS